MIFSSSKKCLSTFCILFAIFITIPSAWCDEVKARQVLVELVQTDDRSTHQASLDKLSKLGEPIIQEIVAAWRVGNISRSASTQIVYWKVADNTYQNLATGELAIPADDHKKSRASRKLRKQLSKIVDFLDLRSPDMSTRAEAARKLGATQKLEHLEILRNLSQEQTSHEVKLAFEEAIALCLIAHGSEDEKVTAIKLLGDRHVLAANGFIEKARKIAVGADATNIISAADIAMRQIKEHQQFIDVIGTIVRGLSTGSVLLLVSYGLAITFGQMGVINMAHGEFIAIGGYSVYLVQNFIITTYGESSAMYDWYFIIAIPIAFLISAIAGAILEKGLIQFLYSRPLESLLATWAVSMVMQQAFRLYFGAANVSVSSPDWLSGSANFGGVLISFNRLSLIIFAIFVVVVTKLLLSKTNWGLHVRATMQNRQMASSLGVPSSRVNMLTFAFGSGLAGLAGAFISQIGNVGPSMGQTYIVDSFMVVVVGGVGNLLGAAISSLGIGMIDQGLQPILGPVMGKITVLFMIIAFLQFKPGGIFPARSRSLDD
ncbi:urea ABC transporter permease subunit UrtB [Rubritalea marina]|uniref:urea ABC transporter permease subunit UrtB n=1 Tax=Rubritalea marina TaxID=361055 RepID=UPI00035E9A92|nr:urea ABC transporter permease subunit UrtB [Rubritalea marina]